MFGSIKTTSDISLDSWISLLSAAIFLEKLPPEKVKGKKKMLWFEFILGKLNASCKIYSLVVNGQSFLVIDGYLLNLFQIASNRSVCWLIDRFFINLEISCSNLIILHFLLGHSHVMEILFESWGNLVWHLIWHLFPLPAIFFKHIAYRIGLQEISKVIQDYPIIIFHFKSFFF